eukprot:scaffold2825_cov36-Phaeocystis_antarctica.AAC.1
MLRPLSPRRTKLRLVSTNNGITRGNPGVGRGLSLVAPQSNKPAPLRTRTLLTRPAPRRHA